MTTKISIPITWPAVPGATKYTVAVSGKLITSTVPPTVHGLSVANGEAVVISAIFPAPPPPAVTNHLWLIHEGGGLTSYATEIASYYGVVVSEGDTASANPRTLMYADGALIASDGGSGVPYAAAQSAGYLTSVNSPDYPGDTFADIRQVAYQQWFAQEVVATAKAQGFAGVYLDDVGVTPNSDVVLPGYTQPEYQAAMLALVVEVGAACKGNDLYLLVNANAFISGVQGDDAAPDIAWAQQLAPNVGGILKEGWMTYQDPNTGNWLPRVEGADWNQNAQSWITLPTAVEAAGCDFVGLTYDPEANAIYGYAAVLTECKRPGSGFMWGADSDPVALVGLYTGTSSIDLAAGTGVVS